MKSGLQSYPQARIVLRVGSLSRFDRRPGCARVMVHPPAKEQLTSLLIDFTVGAFVKLAFRA